MMKRLTIEIDDRDVGQRIDVLISEKLSLSRAHVQKMLDDEQVLIEGKPVKKNWKAAQACMAEAFIDEPHELIELMPQDIPLDIVYEDGDVIVVNKPRGMVVHPAPGNLDGTLVNALLYHCKSSLSGIGGVKRPGIVHRIDKDTSGLLISAKNDDAHLSLSMQLKSRSLTRGYEAVVLGGFKEDTGTVDAPIGRSVRDRKKMAVIETGREAQTDYAVVARYQGYTRLRCHLRTGRTHQIRVHMAHIGHPVAGDLVYGSKNDKTGLSGQCLHARKLEFIHPKTGEGIRLITPLPDYFVKLLVKIGK